MTNHVTVNNGTEGTTEERLTDYITRGMRGDHMTRGMRDHTTRGVREDQIARDRRITGDQIAIARGEIVIARGEIGEIGEGPIGEIGGVREGWSRGRDTETIVTMIGQYSERLEVASSHQLLL